MISASKNDLPRLCLLAYSPVARDARVLRQARYLAPHFRVTVAGFGENPFTAPDAPDVDWFELDKKGSHAAFSDQRLRVLAMLARFSAKCAEAYTLSIPFMRHGWHLAQAARYRVIYCNDVDTLPAGVAALKKNRWAKIILDLHEYPTREAEGGSHWIWERKPFVTGVLKHMARRAHGTVTVADSFAPLMEKEFTMKRPIIVRNAPDLQPLPSRTQPDGRIHLVHHGAAIRTRNMEAMIEAVRLADKRFVLHFMLTGDGEYIADLKRIAAEKCPDRVIFEQAVRPHEIVGAISRYDVGVYILPPRTFNDLHAMPNKFFDFIGAGLAVCVAPSVNMARITQDNGIGWVADDFEPASFAKLLDTITLDQIEARRIASMNLRETINAGAEMSRLVDLVKRISAQKKSAA